MDYTLGNYHKGFKVFTLNSLKGGYTMDYCSGYYVKGDTRSVDYS